MLVWCLIERRASESVQVHLQGHKENSTFLLNNCSVPLTWSCFKRVDDNIILVLSVTPKTSHWLKENIEKNSTFTTLCIILLWYCTSNACTHQWFKYLIRPQHYHKLFDLNISLVGYGFIIGGSPQNRKAWQIRYRTGLYKASRTSFL